METTALQANIDSVAETSKPILIGATWTALVLNIILSGVLNQMLGMINSLQLIVHLVIFNVAFPPNAEVVF